MSEVEREEENILRIISMACLSLIALTGCSASLAHKTSATEQALHSSVENASLHQEDRQREKAQSTSEITDLVQKIQSEDESERDNARTALMLEAKKSEAQRQKVISALMGLLNRPDTRQSVIESPAKFETWKAAVLSLGELKAREALPVLIACLDCTGEVAGLSLSHYPATKAVIMIGDDAIPDLEKALSDNRPSIRKYAALALGEIGGKQAKNSLENAYALEQDEGVKYMIERALIHLKE